MDKRDFRAMVDRYSAELMATAARSQLPPEEAVPAPSPAGEAPASESRPPAESPPQTEINPPESGPGQDPLQDIRPENPTYEAFIAENPSEGNLRVQVYSGRQSYPIPAAHITVTRDFADGMKTFAETQTDANGVADNITLPAPDRSLSQKPEGEAPYAAYDIVAAHPDYRTEIYRQVPVFAGIKSIQGVQLTPVEESGPA